MSDAILTLVAAILGGGLVLIGDIVARRAQWKRELRLLLREKGAEWVASANEARSVLTGARLAGRGLTPEEDLKWGERARASSTLYTVPGADRLDAQIRAVYSTLSALNDALPADDDTWTRHSEACLRAVKDFTDSLRKEIGAIR